MKTGFAVITTLSAAALALYALYKARKVEDRAEKLVEKAIEKKAESYTNEAIQTAAYEKLDSDHIEKTSKEVCEKEVKAIANKNAIIGMTDTYVRVAVTDIIKKIPTETFAESIASKITDSMVRETVDRVCRERTKDLLKTEVKNYVSDHIDSDDVSDIIENRISRIDIEDRVDRKIKTSSIDEEIKRQIKEVVNDYISDNSEEIASVFKKEIKRASIFDYERRV